MNYFRFFSWIYLTIRGKVKIRLPFAVETGHRMYCVRSGAFSFDILKLMSQYIFIQITLMFHMYKTIYDYGVQFITDFNSLYILKQSISSHCIEKRTDQSLFLRESSKICKSSPSYADKNQSHDV